MRSYKIHKLIYMQKIIIKIKCTRGDSTVAAASTNKHVLISCDLFYSLICLRLFSSLFSFPVCIHLPLISLRLRGKMKKKKTILSEFFVNFARDTSDHIALRNWLAGHTSSTRFHFAFIIIFLIALLPVSLLLFHFCHCLVPD